MSRPSEPDAETAAAVTSYGRAMGTTGEGTTQLVVRRPRFEWSADVPLLPFPDDPAASCELVALSFTLPYLEPYLIRTMRAASKQVDDPDLAADMKAFSGQEAQHHQNHARLNDAVRAQLSKPTATALRALEDRLDADYRRSSANRSLAFNLAYAEGFEAMTFALARSMIDSPDSEAIVPEWQAIALWHLAEEIEHRTVTFDAYESIVGSYPYSRRGRDTGPGPLPRLSPPDGDGPRTGTGRPRYLLRPRHPVVDPTAVEARHASRGPASDLAPIRPPPGAAVGTRSPDRCDGRRRPPVTEPAVETITLEANGLTFTALAAGDAGTNRGLVLLLHGFPDTPHTFRHQLRSLAEAGYRAVAPTMRGYETGSQPADGDYSLPSLAADAVGWIDDLGAPTAHLVGHDWGAAVAFVAGSAHPERLRTITAMAIPPLTRIPAAIPRVPRQLLRSWYMTWFQLPWLADRSITVADRRLLRRLWRSWSPGLTLDDEEWEPILATFDRPGVVAASLAYYRQNATPPILLGIRKTPAMRESTIPVPTLIVNGADDGCMDRRLFTRTIDDRDFPAGVAHVELADAGHFLHLERPTEVDRLLLEHLAES